MLSPVFFLKSEAEKCAAEAMAAVYKLSPNDIAEACKQQDYSLQIELGDIALPCHRLAKLVRKSPVQIATELADHINTAKKSTWLKEATSINGYLNFFFKMDELLKFMLNGVTKNTLFTEPLLPKEAREKIIIEYSQPNTHKALHFGHTRNAVYGEAVCRLLGKLGHEVVRATYPGDMGAHIAKVLWYIQKFKAKELSGSINAIWLGNMYAEADDFVKKEEAEGRGESLKKEIGTLFKQLEEAKPGPLYDLYLKTRQLSLDQMQAAYDWLGIHFDVWFYESECDAPSRKLVLKKFAEGFFVRSEGAIGIDLNQYGLGFGLFLRSDDTGLYLTKDLELIRRKFDDPTVTRSIYVVDSRQKLHFQQLFKTAELMGYPQAAKSIHLGYELVTEEDGKPFSSRSMNGVPLDELRLMISRKIIDNHLAAYALEWTPEEIKSTSESVTLGALKYGLLKVDPNKIIRFVLNEWIQLDGDTGPYLQYSYARCCSILQKVGQPAAQFTPTFEFPVERELILQLEKFNSYCLTAGSEYRPSVLCTYLYDLAKLFNRFYKDCPMKTAANEDLKNTRLTAVLITQYVMKKGFELIGIPALQRL